MTLTSDSTYRMPSGLEVLLHRLHAEQRRRVRRNTPAARRAGGKPGRVRAARIGREKLAVLAVESGGLDVRVGAKRREHGRGITIGVVESQRRGTVGGDRLAEDLQLLLHARLTVGEQLVARNRRRW